MLTAFGSAESIPKVLSTHCCFSANIACASSAVYTEKSMFSEVLFTPVTVPSVAIVKSWAIAFVDIQITPATVPNRTDLKIFKSYKDFFDDLIFISYSL